MTGTRSPRGIESIQAMFGRAKAQSRSAFLPYFPIGFPSFAESLDIIQSMAEAGADGFEIGIPFSDPLADGPVIQAATQVALENGTTVRQCLDAVQTLRDRGVEQPMLLMGYVNPLIAFGMEAFVQAAKRAGADGLIVPDLPVEEGAQLSAICRQHGMALVFFLAPTSGDDRMALVAQQATGFIYVVTLTGVTGARQELPPDLTDFVKRLRRQAEHVPLVTGFGISTPEQARSMNELVDGFIVGSALVRAGQVSVESVLSLTQSIVRAIQPPDSSA